MRTGKSKIQFALLIVAAISLGTTLLSLSFMNRMAEDIRQIAFNDARITKLGESITMNILKARREEKNFIIYLDTLYIQYTRDILMKVREDIAQEQNIAAVYRTKLDSINTMLDQYEQRLGSLVLIFQENPRTLLRLQKQIIEYENTIKNFAKDQTAEPDNLPDLSADMNVPLFYANNLLSTEKSRLFAELKTLTNGLIKIGESITALARNSLVTHSQEGLSYTLRAQRNTITLLLMAALLLIFLIFYLPYRIFLPHKNLKRLLSGIARGNLEIDMSDAHTDDELGELSQSFESALRDLQKLNRLKTAKIAADRRNLIRIIEEVSEAVIIISPDLAINHMNEIAKTMFQKQKNSEINTLKDIQLLWESLEETVMNIEKKGRTESVIKINKHNIRGKKAVLIPNMNRIGKLDSIIIIVK